MQLKNKTVTGVIQPLSYVDRTLRQQGFRRVGEGSVPIYDVVIYDSSTSTSYFLRIPTSITHGGSGKGELSVKIGHPYLEAKILIYGPDESFVIPQAVKRAAEDKLKELAAYLLPADSDT
ncbi:hypothetical protein [Brevibacillus dissolubilis]|uniref:hypothetical protein n=1 Tax=Brevibacillus dissolubilis TaxID=1844116 RepID=UPI001116B3AA|nr:hypothetical protein [Brevibacillus dissolubilis]